MESALNPFRKGSGMITRAAAAILCVLSFAAPAQAAQCGGDFNSFIAAIAREASAQGISQPVISSAFAGVTPDPAVLSFDRRQRGTFRQSFEQYASTRVSPARLSRARALMARNAALLARIEA